MSTSTVEKLGPTRAKLTIVVTPEELKPSITHAYAHIAEQINIPGFRKGKVPPPIIDQRIGRAAVLEHAVKEGLDVFYREAVEHTKLRPLGNPDANISEWPSDKDFSGDLLVTVEVDVRPEITLPEYDQVEVQVESLKVTDDEVVEELDRLRERFGTLITVDRPAKKGDFVQIDLVARIDGHDVDDANAISYELGSGDLLEGIDEALDMLSAGESTTFESTLVGGDRANETAEISVSVRAVKERELPEADDDFAQIASEFDTVEELLVSLREQVERSKKFLQSTQARNSFIEKLLERVEVPVPEKMVEDQVHQRLEEENKFDDAERRSAVTELSVRTLRTQFLLDEIALAEGVQVSQDELAQYLVQGAAQYGMEPNEFIKILSDNNQIPQIVGEIARNKALALALGKAHVTDAAGHPVDLSETIAVSREDESTGASDVSSGG
jgi:trigger factor